jgi:secondary thiamine-phosphate synthase enzyme
VLRSSKAFTQTLEVKSQRRTQLLDVTVDVQRAVVASGVQHGLCHLYVSHTTAAITINESADPDVARDIEASLDRLVPPDGPYKHFEGNADSHVKSSLVGVSQTISIENGHLLLGRWQGIFFCEFDGPRTRHLHLRIVPD